MKKIIAIIQARTGSIRLPAKVLLKLSGKTVLEHVIDRVKRSRLIKEVIVATTIHKKDLRIVDICVKKGIRVYCGSENDVLDRYFQTARLFKAEYIVRITADCPFIDPRVIDRAIRLHLVKRADYTSNTIKRTFPDGEDVEVFTFGALKKAWQNAKLSSEREHVTPYIKNHPKLFKLANLSLNKNYSHKRWTLDEVKDFKFIKLIYHCLYKKNRDFGMKEVIKLLNQHPEYEKINREIKGDVGYLKFLKHDKIIKPDYLSR